MRINKKLAAACLILVVLTLQVALGEKSPWALLAGYLRSESGVSLKMVSPQVGSAQENETASVGLVVNPRSSGFRLNESGYALEGNTYASGVGGRKNESGVTLNLVPEGAFKSYSDGVTAYDETTTTSSTSSTSTTIEGTTTSTTSTSTTIPAVSFNQTINTTAGNATTVNASSVNVTLEITTNASVTDANITVSSYTSNPTNTSFSVPSLGKYIEITASATLSGSLNYTLLRVQYTDAEVAAAGLNESELALWWHNTTTNTWQILNSSTMSWVHATGVDTTANFVWANVTHFSVYTVAESSQISQTPLTSGWNLISVPLTNQ